MTGRSRDLGGGRRDRVPRASGSSSPRESTSLVLSLPSWRRAGGGANAISSTLPPPSRTPPFLPPPSLICRSTSSCPLSTSLPQTNTQPAIFLGVPPFALGPRAPRPHLSFPTHRATLSSPQLLASGLLILFLGLYSFGGLCPPLWASAPLPRLPFPVPSPGRAPGFSGVNSPGPTQPTEP